MTEDRLIVYTTQATGGTMWPNENEDSVEYSDNERCGDVEREEVEDQLIQEVEVEELTGYLSW